ncbi:hypothetical protein MFLAVUS_009752 [Mucor flavus]|uniref:Uncharacterized protein n=1 Tax=Mucor flavus TaxID=439312 RepID=A0ABP9ZAW4_9FUNG
MEQKYNACKTRNEQQLLDTRKLELDIAKVNQLVHDKRKSTLAIKEKNELYKKLIREQNSGKAEPLKSKPAIGGKRDLSLLLDVTPEKVIQRIEHLLRTRSLFHQHPEPEQLYSIRQLIKKLKDPYNPDHINALLQKLTDSFSPVSHAPATDTIDPEKEKVITEFYKHRKAKVDDLKAKIQELEAKCEKSETVLVHRIQELNQKQVVQSALTKMVRIKAANQQIKTELKSMQDQTNELGNQIQFIKDQSRSDTKNVSDIMEVVARTQWQVQSLLATNIAFDVAVLEQKEKARHSKEADLNIDRINTALSKLRNQNNRASQLIENQPSELLDAKSAISPYSSISDIQLFKELVYLIQSIDNLEKTSIVNVCSDIRKTLEDLVEKWSSLLNKRDVSLLNTLPENHDGIDNVIQSLDAIRMHFKENERQYLNEQERKMSRNLDTIRQIEKEADQVRKDIDERLKDIDIYSRKLIATVGQTFTIEDKSFCEWLQEVEQ